MRSPDSQRYLQAARHVETGQVPFQENDPDMVAVNQLLDADFPLRWHSYDIPPRDLVNLYTTLGCDMVYLANLWELGRKNEIDETGRKHYVDGVIKTPEQLRDVKLPDLGETRRKIEGVLEAMEGSGLGLIYWPNHTPRLVALAVGYQDYCMALMDDPDFILEFQKVIDEYCLAELELALDLGADVIQLSADLCMVSGPMYSRDVLDRFEFPLFRRTVDVVHSRSALVCAHVDGNLAPILADLIEMGPDILNPIEPCGGQDICQIKQQYGSRIALQGNLDVAEILVSASAEDISAATRQLIEPLAVGGGYIVASSHNITEHVPLKNLFAFRDAAHEPV